MPEPVPVIHCINQFFGGLGGEESANLSPRLVTGAKGPGILFEKLAPGFRIVATVIFGDNNAAERRDAAVSEMLDLIEEAVASGSIPEPELLLAGPAFNAGRYGMTCGALCSAAAKRFGIPTVTGMFEENPGVDLFRRKAIIIRTESNVLGMQEAMKRISAAAGKLLAGETPEPSLDKTFPRGIRVNRWDPETGARRALEMLLKKCRGEPFCTEYELPSFNRVTPAPPVANTGKARIALVTSGGIVPRGNPDHIEAASASRFGEYDISELDALSPKTHETAHGGYDPTYANADPNRVLPLDMARALEKEGRIGKLHESYYATVGNATSVERAEEFGRDIARRLLDQEVQAVILTST